MRVQANKTGVLLAAGCAAGAALMYFLDPQQGRRRRALVRDQLEHARHAAGEAVQRTRADTRNRAGGLIAEARARTRGKGTPPDQTLVDRVRAEMGRVVSHPGSIIVTADGGRVVVSGPILAKEVDPFLSCVRRVRGVDEVENRLDVHETPGNVPGLQGGSTRQGAQFELLQRNWSPAARLATGAAGGGLVAFGATKRGALGTALALGGLGLLVRSSSNLELKRLAGLGGRGAVDLQKTITIQAPVDVVFGFFGDFENYPEFMSHVRRVRETGDGRTHWEVDGPAGTTVEWDAVVSRIVPNEVIEWKSVQGSMVDNAGSVRFEPTADGGTRVTVRMSYSPPGGATGNVVSSMLGANPRKEMEDDLNRLKTTIETGVPPHDAAARRESQPTRAT